MDSGEAQSKVQIHLTTPLVVQKHDYEVQILTITVLYFFRFQLHVYGLAWQPLREFCNEAVVVRGFEPLLEATGLLSSVLTLSLSHLHAHDDVGHHNCDIF